MGKELVTMPVLWMNGVSVGFVAALRGKTLDETVHAMSEATDTCQHCSSHSFTRPRIQITYRGTIRLYASCSTCGKGIRLKYRVFTDDKYAGILKDNRADIFEDCEN